MPAQLDWLLDDLVARVAKVTKAVILSRDGLTMGASDGLSREDSEYLCAAAAGLQSLARGTGHHFGAGAVRQTIIEMESAFLFVMAAGEGSCIAVLAGEGADVGLVAYEMTLLVVRVGEHLAVARRGGRAARGGVSAMPAGGEWLDQDAGPVVRPYALTGGLTRPSGQRFDLLDMVRTARRTGGDPPQLTPEQAEMLQRCEMPVPIAELAGGLNLPIGVIRILVSDLRERGLVTIHRAQPAGFNDLKILQEVVNGLRRL